MQLVVKTGQDHVRYRKLIELIELSFLLGIYFDLCLDFTSPCGDLSGNFETEMSSSAGVAAVDEGRESSPADTTYRCCVPLCRNLSVDNPSLSFHSFPNSQPENKNIRNAWIIAIIRAGGPRIELTPDARVCSAHFQPEDFNTLPGQSQWVLMPTAVPSVFRRSQNASQNLSSQESVERDVDQSSDVPARASAKRRHSQSCTCEREHVPGREEDEDYYEEDDYDDEEEEEEGDDDDEEVICHCTCCDCDPTLSGDDASSPLPRDVAGRVDRDEDYLENLPDGTKLPPAVSDYIQSLKKQVSSLQSQVKDLKSRMTSLEALKENDADFYAATGLPNYSVFQALEKYFRSKAERMIWWREDESPVRKRIYNLRKRRISIEDQFFAVLVRIRTATSVRELARRLNIKRSFFSIMYTTWINFLYMELSDLMRYTTARGVRHGAVEFKHFPNTRMVVDCAEVFTQRPSDRTSKELLSCIYKNCSSIKFLVGTSPNGAVLYVAKLPGGRPRDEVILYDASDCLDLLQPGEAVMAGRGFFREEDVTALGCKLYVPPPTTKGLQLSASEDTRAKRIAAARAHTESVIRRIKHFRILQWFPPSILDLSLQTFAVCAYLTYFQDPVIVDTVDL